METLVVPPAVRARLGVEASEGLVDMFAAYQQFSTDRFESRLIQVDAGLRLEFERGFASLRVEMERARADVIKWTLMCWIGQFAAITAALSFMLSGR